MVRVQHMLGMMAGGYGVGSWGAKGIDAGAYARELMNHSANLVRNQSNGEDVNPTTILKEAYIHTRLPGSSTACLLTLKDNNWLDVVNVGDSGFMLIRNGACIYKSPVQQYQFNYPYQLKADSAVHEPTKAMKMDIRVEAGDMIVLATDGLFDNLFSKEIEETIQEGIERMIDPEGLAGHLACKAFYKSMDKTARTPFALDSGGKFSGGKQDDITVIVSRINRL
ncbi:hypothetical protein ACFE04_015508 [Oxalis oulophora]